MLQWNYVAKSKKETGYEDLVLRFCPTQAEFCNLTVQEQDEFVEKLIDKIYELNIFPIYYYNEAGILDEIREVFAKDVSLEKGVNHKMSAGIDLLNYLFPNLHQVLVRGSAKSVYDRFYDRNDLRKILKYYLPHFPLHNMKTAFLMSARYLWASATNFLPLRAKAIYEHFCENGDTVYDYSAGFGGRMLGCLCSNKNLKYIGTDPNTETFEHLQTLGKEIEKVSGRSNSFELFNYCSENLELPEESIDFAFSCPPYYKVEHYSKEETQCTNKYKTYEDWLEKYARPTIEHAYKALKKGKHFGFVLASSLVFGYQRDLVADWTKIALETGFKACGEPVDLKINNRKGDEKLYVFRRELTL